MSKCHIIMSTCAYILLHVGVRDLLLTKTTRYLQVKGYLNLEVATTKTMCLVEKGYCLNKSICDIFGIQPYCIIKTCTKKIRVNYFIGRERLLYYIDIILISYIGESSSCVVQYLYGFYTVLKTAEKSPLSE